MRKIIAFLLMALPGLVLAVEAGYPLDPAPINLEDKTSLQRGARLFVNYCMGCHSVQYQRYNRLARDVGLTDELVLQNLVFTGAKVGDTMQNAMSKTIGDDGKPAARRWFGAQPPDLSLIARSRGVDYLYTYLRTFYVDEKRPLGVNNAVFPMVGMPHALWELQGLQKPIYEKHKDAEGNETEVIVGFQQVVPGKLNATEYNAAVADLVNFLAYVAEPIKLERQRIGVWVLAFLALCIVVFYLLKEEYWKDVH
ncbi:MAG TPA: cytochrome c1 [Candidatus Competibacteraceae bacterium]|nr:cytochrome c1 [Candidatus Competibacteraceae bacterium]